MPRTALDLITASLKRLNVISGIETPTADLAEDSLQRLNDLIETWRTEQLIMWAQEPTTIPIVAGTQLYLLGPGAGSALATRPEWLAGVNVQLAGTPDFEMPLGVYDREDWRTERVKTQTSSLPTHYHYEMTWPQSELWIWPEYSGGNVLGLVLYLPVSVTSLPTLTTSVDFPSGYFRALRDNLAIELAPELGRMVDPALQYAAADALAQVKRHNFRPRILHLPAALAEQCGHAYNWMTDE